MVEYSLNLQISLLEILLSTEVIIFKLCFFASTKKSSVLKNDSWPRKLIFWVLKADLYCIMQNNLQLYQMSFAMILLRPLYSAK